MKFLADENFPMPSVRLLQSLGYDTTHVGMVAAGISDEEVVAMANRDGRTLLTFDGDLGALAFAHGIHADAGIVYFRLTHYSPEAPGRMLSDYLTAHPHGELAGRMTVFDPPRVRQRLFE